MIINLLELILGFILKIYAAQLKKEKEPYKFYLFFGNFILLLALVFITLEDILNIMNWSLRHFK